MGTYVEVVDLPGDPHLVHFMERPLKKADVVIFVLDGAKFLNHLSDAAM